jgi:alkylation response protein AidB-like acyl-CoA dehydrogenase
MFHETFLERGGSFFSKSPERIFSVEDFGSEERMMIDAANNFCRTSILPVVERLDKQEEGLSINLVRQAGELGFCGIDAPEEFGGLGLGKNLAARILEFLSMNASFSVTIGITSGISQFGLIGFGTKEQKAKYLPKLTSGEWIGAYALSEPNSGSDALSVSTRAEKRGDSWVLNGTKMWISNAAWANFFLVMAKIDGEKFSAFLVERDMPGVSISREEHKMGLKGSSTARLVLEDAVVPLENLLHEPGKGYHVAFNALNVGRFKLSSMSMGPARNAIELAASYTQERRQFGKSISEFGLIRQKLALMAARFWGVESVIYRTGSLIDNAFANIDDSIEQKMAASAEFAIECSASKILATEAEAFIVDEALQCYGGYGFTEEFPIARHYRDARVSRIYEGTNEINRIFLADRLFRKASEGTASLEGCRDSFVAELAYEAFKKKPESQIQLGALSDLLLLTYAEQSSRLRAKQVGGIGEELHKAFVNWLNVEAVRAYGMATGKGATIPDMQPVNLEDIAGVVLETKGPVQPK